MIRFTPDPTLTQFDMKIGKQSRPVSCNTAKALPAVLLMLLCLASTAVFAQSGSTATGDLISMPGIIITITLLIIPVVAALFLLVVKANALFKNIQNRKDTEEATRFARYLKTLNVEQLESLQTDREHQEYHLNNKELSGPFAPEDSKGLLSSINARANIRFIEAKRKAIVRPDIDPALSRLILWFLGTATFWLIFGRLRPVHTNAVFWGWSSLAMLGLGYYVVPRVSNIRIHSLKSGWWTLILINASVVFGTIALMAGINNGGGEYREYIWPIQLLFGIGLVITLFNFLRTVASRKTTEIYVSNWYIVAAVMFAIVISIVAYVPNFQNGLGETIIQGYYMH